VNVVLLAYDVVINLRPLRRLAGFTGFAFCSLYGVGDPLTVHNGGRARYDVLHLYCRLTACKMQRV